MTRMSPTIQDYAAIGDGRSLALVSRDGFIDWLCWPRFDSPTLLAALLDQDTGGTWGITPVEPARIERSYVEQTNVLQTRFITSTGSLILTDLMPVASEAEKRRVLWPEQELIRQLTCEQGEAEAQVYFDPRLDYGQTRAAIHDAGPLGLRIKHRAALFTLRSDVPLVPSAEGGLCGRVTLRAGESAAFSLSYSAEGPAVIPPLGEIVEQKLEQTIRWWRQWADQAQYAGPHREAIVRSALALKLMCFAPSGAIIAAPTTSLPETVGSTSNWDYRYCWLRDAAFTVRALIGLGYYLEAEAFASWLIHATRLTHPELLVVYDVYGRSPPKERELSTLKGYRQSVPVRIGNAASDQLQLDVYGEVIDAVTMLVEAGWRLDRVTQKILQQLGEHVCRHWQEPDHGLWEVRGAKQHFTHSRLMCWVALDRLLRLHRLGHLPRALVDQFARHRQLIRDDIQHHAWNPNLASYTQTLSGDTVDATALLLGLHGFEPITSPRMVQTYQCVLSRLHAGAGLVYRNEESFESGEGAFLICSFWVSQFLARGGGTFEQALRTFEQTLSHVNDLGLFAEEIAPRGGDALGNFPQAFTHVGLINSALSLTERGARSTSAVEVTGTS